MGDEVMIADCQLPIADLKKLTSANQYSALIRPEIGNWQSSIGNRQSAIITSSLITWHSRLACGSFSVAVAFLLLVGGDSLGKGIAVYSENGGCL
jgi:hypothetical protein